MRFLEGWYNDTKFFNSKNNEYYFVDEENTQKLVINGIEKFSLIIK